MSEPKPEYNTQPDDCHAHSHDDNHGVEFWRRAPVTDAQYRRVLAERAILEVKVQELQAYADKLAAGLPVGMLPQDVENLRRANEQFAVDVDALTLQLQEANEDATRLFDELESTGNLAHSYQCARDLDKGKPCGCGVGSVLDKHRARVKGELSTVKENLTVDNDGSFVQAFQAQMMAIHQTNTGNGFTIADREFMAKLLEEVEEVAGAIIDCKAQIPNFETSRMNLTVELADVVIAIMFYAAGNNLPLAAAIEAKNAHNKTRGYLHGKTQQ